MNSIDHVSWHGTAHYLLFNGLLGLSCGRFVSAIYLAKLTLGTRNILSHLEQCDF